MNEIKEEFEIINNLKEDKYIDWNEIKKILHFSNKESVNYLYQTARGVCKENYGNKVYCRGLIEFTNFCKNNCYYCGIRKENQALQRYRLEKDEILACAKQGYELGFRTFVLQGGEDVYFTKERLGSIVLQLKKNYPDCAVTLSVGERDYDTYQYWFDCGADRYLLRHETANDRHYQKLHPIEMSIKERKECLWNLKKIGYQVGAGFMVGSPWQNDDNLVQDLIFLRDLQPAMVGIGPFLSQKDTPFADKADGSLELTLKLLSIIRLILPKVLLPATTALGTIHPKGRELGILAGANVVMPNLSPENVRDKYILYDNKKFSGQESAQGRWELQKRLEEIGYHLVTDRGDSKMS